MTTHFDILIPGSPIETREVELAADPGYDAIARVLAPWFGKTEFEHVNILMPDRTTYSDMFVDEMGHPKGLPANDAATVHYVRNAQVHHIPGWEDVWIAGPAIVFHRRVWF